MALTLAYTSKQEDRFLDSYFKKEIVGANVPVRIRIFDTTMRDGEQTPGVTMTPAEKLLIASQLEKMNVDVIEAGFPASSPGEFEAARRIAETIRSKEVSALCRTRESDIERAWEAIQHADAPLLHLFIATSALHLKHKLKMTEAELLREVHRAVSTCRDLCPRVEYTAEDCTRADPGFLKEVCECAIEAGATILNVADTVGYTLPWEYEAIVRSVVEVVGDRLVTVSAHCHNDLGLAVANSLAGIRGGSTQVECTINGIGERAGNASLEEVVMAIRMRGDLLNCKTTVDTTQIYPAAMLVKDITNLPLQHNKAIVGRNAFAHESGVHQHAVLAEKSTYEIMKPHDIGRADSILVLGKHSGRAALRNRLVAQGYHLSDGELDRVFSTFKDLADNKQNIYEEDLHILVENQLLQSAKRYRLDSIEYGTDRPSESWAKVAVSVDGVVQILKSVAEDSANAVMAGVKRCTDNQGVSVNEYSIISVTEGTDVLARVSVSNNGLLARGQGSDSDAITAAAKALVNALNHLSIQKRIREERGA